MTFSRGVRGHKVSGRGYAPSDPPRTPMLKILLQKSGYRQLTRQPGHKVSGRGFAPSDPPRTPML